MKSVILKGNTNNLQLLVLELSVFFAPPPVEEYLKSFLSKRFLTCRLLHTDLLTASFILVRAKFNEKKLISVIETGKKTLYLKSLFI